MRRAFWRIFGCGAAAVVSGVVALELTVSGRADLRERAVLTRSDALILMPAELICGPQVEQVHWSPRDRYVLVEHIVRQGEPTAEQRLSVYDRKRRELDVVWRCAAGQGSIAEVTWFPGTDTALVSVQETLPPSRNLHGTRPTQVFRLLRVVAPSASARPVRGSESNSGSSASMSRRYPVAVVAVSPTVEGQPHRSGSHPILRFAVHADGRVGPAIPEPPDGPYRLEWTVDGSPIFHRHTRTQDGAGRSTAHSIDLATGRTSRLDVAPRSYDYGLMHERRWGTNPRLRTANTSVSRDGASRRMRTLWLETTDESVQPRALVTGDATFWEMSSNADAVVYIEKRSAWIAPINRISIAAYDELARMAVLQDARTVGTALRMYSEDYDEEFPLDDHFAGGAVAPYLRDASTSEGFTYLYPGKGIKKTADLSLGYLPGPGGRATVAADGTVKWVPSSR